MSHRKGHPLQPSCLELTLVVASELLSIKGMLLDQEVQYGKTE